MAKRVRGAGVRNTHRPGGHPPVRPTGTRTTTRSTGAADDPAPEPAALAATGTAVAAAAPATVAPTRSTRGRVKVKEGSLLAERAAQEYVYVGKDLRRIVVVAAVLFAALIGIWVLLTAVDPFGLY